MTEDEMLNSMVLPSQRRNFAWLGGVIQIFLTRTCDLACSNCTQFSQLSTPIQSISISSFTTAVESLEDYFGVVGIFGGNPATHKQFTTLCDILKLHIPYERRGIWCNNPLGKAGVMRQTFNPFVSNLNVHGSQKAYDEFKRDWPESMPFGLEGSSYHAPVYVSPNDLGIPFHERNRAIANCDINKNWSAMICEINGKPYGYFCEIAAAQAMLKGDPSAGLPVTKDWWKQGIDAFKWQIKKHCHECGVPYRFKGNIDNEHVTTVSKSYEPLVQLKTNSVLNVIDATGQTQRAVTDYYR